jgi:hypothetical protein
MDRSEPNTKPANSTAQDDATPQHRVHSPNEPLPGAHDDRQQSKFSESGGSRFHEEVAGEQGQNAFNSERPLDVRPTQTGGCNTTVVTEQTSRCLTGGVARGGQDDLPMGKASFLDKVIGKAEKVGYPR